MFQKPELEQIIRQIIEKYNPQDIYVFGSYAKGVVHRYSDIDLCLIVDVQNKRAFKRRLHLEIDYDVDLDIVVYTPEQWQKYNDDPARFANIIDREGESLIGRFH
ncbi:nucleotidyltransferase domain-containing protein [Tindallia californiensis]|uniref:Nucleotidyltransferase domain-containing protein n=1 Tax=Tindallia californiensis TaxID=159292 RepID=A0A1H3NHT9_9FIRM|nr:nucleotidyltransferase domain-containing protein [Tindallia californiensis]SDY88388.1 Nucleotidyltransferase domain-containing protein [Tindallia californiensis]